jgi:hypothetical protein
VDLQVAHALDAHAAREGLQVVAERGLALDARGTAGRRERELENDVVGAQVD